MSRNGHSKIRRSQITTATRRAKQPARRTSTGTVQAQQPEAMSSSSSSALNSAASSLKGYAGSALSTIKSHPMPFALAGVGVACAGAGLAWLLVSSAKTMTDENGNPLAASQRLQTSMKGATQSVKRVGRAANEKVSQLAHDAFESGRSLEQSVEDVVREHPIAVGAALIATGAAIALAIPRSALEDTWLGRERDQMVSSAQRIAKGAAQKVEALTKQVTGNASNNNIAHA